MGWPRAMACWRTTDFPSRHANLKSGSNRLSLTQGCFVALGAQKMRGALSIVMRFSEFSTQKQATEPPPVVFKLRVGAASALRAKHIVERHRGRQLLACERDGQNMVLTIAVTGPDDDWET